MLADKYYVGPRALCRVCSGRPCSCPPSDATPAPIPLLRSQPTSGNAIPFSVWDTHIHRHELTTNESSTLLFLCRRTIGYGRQDGDYISIADVARGIRVSPSCAKRALTRLAACGLIVRTIRTEPGKSAYARTHIRVTLEPP